MSTTPENHHHFTPAELALKERYDAALVKIAEVAAQRDALKEANASASRELAAVTAERDALKSVVEKVTELMGGLITHLKAMKGEQ